MSDRQLWLEEPCPTCGVRSGLRCQTSRYSGKPSWVLQAPRGWRQRSCPTCKAQAGELCKTPTGRRAAQPHTARLHPGRRELFAEQGVWEELERWEAASARVGFSPHRPLVTPVTASAGDVSRASAAGAAAPPRRRMPGRPRARASAAASFCRRGCERRRQTARSAAGRPPLARG